MGHSRLGKAALLCGAMDDRFSLVIACESGAGGAALFRGKEGENVADLCRNFPYWFCGNFKKWQNREAELPFDQHFTAALVAPRHLYLAGAVDDEWADPLSEFLTGQAVTPCLLYTSYYELKDILKKLAHALKKEGILYASFKYGDFEGMRNGRYFIDLTEDKLQKLLQETNVFELKEKWISTDIRPGRDEEKWMNIILIKKSCIY